MNSQDIRHDFNADFSSTTPTANPVNAEEPHFQTPPQPQEPQPKHELGLAAIRQIKLVLARVVIVAAFLLTIRYFYWRATATMNPAAMWFFYIFFIAEALNFFEALLFYITVWAPTHYSSPEPLPGHSVDVYIATYNEPVELLRETVLSAVSMSYPHKTFILDDGKRPAVQQLAADFGCGYLTRPDNTHAKAGNLNNALKQTDAEFVVTLDADHVPSRELINRTIGFFVDPKVGAVQTAQDFYNLDSFQHRVRWRDRVGWQQQELFFSVIQPGKDRFNAAFYCGSPAIIRRTALDDVGGFATESITEDMHTGLRMQKKNWRVLYFNKTLAFGLAPQTFLGFATQWRRWGTGCMQVMRSENPILGRGLTFGQRLCYFASMYFYLMSYQRLAYIMTPVIALLTGIFPLITTPKLFVEFFFPYFFLNLFASALLQGGLLSYIRSEQFNILKMHVLLRAVVGIFKKVASFQVTPKSRANAASFSDLLLPVTICVILTASMVVGIIRMSQTSDQFLFWALVVNLFWGAFYLITMASSIWSSMRRHEVRSMYRFPSRLDVPVKFTYSADDAEVEIFGYGRNLNRMGVSLTADTRIDPGTSVDIELQLPERMVCAQGIVVRNQRYKIKKNERFSNGIRFTKIAVRDQDEISKYLFWQIAPKEMTALRLTSMSQSED
jgi:cellulose synthase (UDP-forming)